MKKCSDIENLLPLYPEGALSEDEKRTVEEHLAHCEACRRELALLKKTDELVKQLPPVEEPPWFAQKVMARVREEAEKKSFARRWFYPLRFKIPLQIMATLVIAVLAVYIYRSGNEQVKTILPGAPPPAVEVMKEQPPAPQQPPAGKKILSAPVSREKSATPAEVRREKPEMEIEAGAAGESIPKAAPEESKAVAAYKPETRPAKGLKEDREEALRVLQDRQNELSLAEEQMKDKERKTQDSSLSVMAKKKEAYKMAAPAAPRAAGTAAEAQQPAMKSYAFLPEARVLLRADDPAVVAAEAQKILVRRDARRVTSEQVEGKVIVRAEAPFANWKEILIELKTLGPLEEKQKPADISGIIRVAIEISGK